MLKMVTCSLWALMLSHILLSQDLILTGVFDGTLPGGNPKGMELYVVNDIPDLSEYGIGIANNGGNSNGEDWIFPEDSATEGDYIYLIANSPDQFEAFFGFGYDYIIGFAGAVSGDDALEVFHLGVVIDTFGEIGVDGSGTSWDYEDGWAYRVCETGPDGNEFIESNWIFSDNDALDGESSNATASFPVPVGTYLIMCDNMGLGCTDSEADNYDSLAITDDGSCLYGGCTDPLYIEFDPYANLDDESCMTLVVLGCTYTNADNYNSLANRDDGSCLFGESCIGDFTGDGEVTSSDLTIFLGVFGETCDP